MDALAGGFAFVLVAALGLSNGGYFETTWGWGALAVLWVAVLALMLSERVYVAPLEAVFVGGLLAFLSFTALSWFWSDSPPAALREVERGLLVFGAVVATLLLARRRMRPLLAGVAAAVVLVSCYGLATRLFPDRLGTFDPIAGYRLAQPLGYWNALGIFAAIGLLLAFGFAARAETLPGRALAWSAPVLLLPTVWFTFGRGPLAAIIVGLAAAIAIDSRRLQQVTVALLLAPFGAGALWLSAREPDLNRRTAALATAADEGRRLAVSLLLLAFGAALAGAAFHLAAPRVHIRERVRRAYAVTLVAIAVAAVAASFAHYGSPQALATRAYHSFTGDTAAVAPNAGLSHRLLSLGNRARIDQWRVAVDDFRGHPWLGSGAGTYEEAWNRQRPAPAWKVRDAHSLYLEVLGELGPIGFSLLVLTLLVPVVAAVRARRHPLAPFALAAYVAYLFHAGVDWDWEMPAVTLAALVCGAALLVAGRKDEDARILTRPTRIAAVGATVALAAFAFVGLMGNLALASSRHTAATADWRQSAAQARRAMRWAPWASEPWRLLGEAQYAQHDFAAARSSFHKALAKDPNSWLLWADLATVSPHGTWRAPARRAVALNPLGPELGDMRAALKKRP